MIPKYNVENIENIIQDYLSSETQFHVPYVTTLGII